MTQPVVTDDPNAQPEQQQPRPPILTHVVEHTVQTLRVIDENGVKSVQVHEKVSQWQLGKSIPNDDTTIIVAMFRDDAGGVRVWVQPKPGTPGAERGLAFLIELPASAIRFTMKTLPITNFLDEIAQDELEFLYNGGEGGEAEPGPLQPSTEPQVNANGAAAIGQG